MKRLKELLPLILSLRILGTLFTLVLIFHGLILARVIPYEIAWGGRLRSDDEMILFESVSIAINALMLIAVTGRIYLLKTGKEPVFLRIIFGIMTLIFLMNTLGNLYAITLLERIVFTPLTAISAILTFRSALSKN